MPLGLKQAVVAYKSSGISNIYLVLHLSLSLNSYRHLSISCHGRGKSSPRTSARRRQSSAGGLKPVASPACPLHCSAHKKCREPQSVSAFNSLTTTQSRAADRNLVRTKCRISSSHLRRWSSLDSSSSLCSAARTSNIAMSLSSFRCAFRRSSRSRVTARRLSRSSSSAL